MSTLDPTIVVLAAGAALRFGSDKLAAPIDAGRSLVDVTLDFIVESHVAQERVVVVAAATDAHAARRARARGMRVAIAHDATDGMSRSLHAGLAAVDEDAPGACIVLADDPIATLALPAALEAARADPASLIAVARTPHVPHPVYLPRSQFTLLPDAGDRGLGALLRTVPVVWLQLDTPAPTDVDEPQHVDALRAAIRRLQGA